MIFFLFYNIREEGKIPSVEGCVIEVAREMPVMVLEWKTGSAPTIELNLSWQGGNQVCPRYLLKKKMNN